MANFDDVTACRKNTKLRQYAPAADPAVPNYNPVRVILSSFN